MSALRAGPNRLVPLHYSSAYQTSCLQIIILCNIQIMSYIREGGRQVEKKFADVLKFCWEGLLFEYLRTVGCPLRDREHDPRHFVMRYWRRSMLDPSVKPGFVPFYAKREVRDERTRQQ